MNTPTSTVPLGLSSGPIVLMAAGNEVDPLLARAAVLTTEHSRLFTLSRARLGGREVLIAGCYTGKVNAAMSAQALIERYRPAALILSGSAGSLSPDVHAGDVIVSECAVQHDAGINLGRRFVHLGTDVAGDRGRQAQRLFYADPGLIGAALAAAELLPPVEGDRPSTVHVGCIATGDQIMFSAERKAWIRATWNALAVEMEGGALAQVAQANGVPWLLVRGISDDADDAAGIDVSRLVRYAEDGPAVGGWMRLQGRRLAYIARHPEAPARLGRLAQGVALAARRAAALTEATVAHLA